MASSPEIVGKDLYCLLAVLDDVPSSTHGHHISDQWLYAAAYSCRLLYKTFRVYAIPSLVTPAQVIITVSRSTYNKATQPQSGMVRPLLIPMNIRRSLRREYILRILSLDIPYKNHISTSLKPYQKRKITLTRRLIIANSIVPLHTSRIRQIRTILRRTPNIRRTTPNNLSHMGPLLKVSVVRLRLAVVVSEVRIFAIVPEFRDDA